MSPEDRDQHRSRIGFEVEVFLHAYWREGMDPLVKAGVLAWWADELEDWSVDQVRWALRKWCRDEPGKRANVGHILAILKRRRGEAHAERMRAAAASAEPDEAPRAPPDAETCRQRQSVLAETVARLKSAQKA